MSDQRSSFWNRAEPNEARRIRKDILFDVYALVVYVFVRVLKTLWQSPAAYLKAMADCKSPKPIDKHKNTSTFFFSSTFSSIVVRSLAEP